METINRYLAELEQMLQSISLPRLETILRIFEDAYHHEQRIFTMGNGGSAATASHFALDLAKNTMVADRPRLKAISLTDHVPLITAWSNDTAYEYVFLEQLATMIEPGDVAVGISASGNSLNVILALQFAKKLGCQTVGLLGAEGGKIKSIVDAYVLAPGQNIEQVEDAHMILTHIITRHMRVVLNQYGQSKTNHSSLSPRFSQL